ncbi:MAG: SAM hydrolase/SAM-dependent halogenase family protein [Gammaproteobacteria bacterium]
MSESSIVLFTDFGPAGPYTGQIESVLHRIAPGVPVIDLLSNAPIANPRSSSYLLPAFRHSFPEYSIFLCVVDPGVGGERRPVVLWADGQYFVGPDNGLLNTVAKHAGQTRWWQIDWRPENCSMTFHGRDLFAPIAAYLAIGKAEPYLQPIDDLNLADWPGDLGEVIYFDGYGNAMTGMRYRPEMQGKVLCVKEYSIGQAGTFNAVRAGEAFWYRNSSGMVEIAVNQGSAQRQLSLELGVEISWIDR